MAEPMKQLPLKTRMIRLVGLVLMIGAATLGIRELIGLYNRTAYPLKYSEYIESYSEQNGLDKYFVYALVRCESSFRPDAESNIGARGLMQLTEETFDWVKQRKGETGDVGFDAMYDPETNIEYGTYLLKMLFDEYGNEEAVLCGYHAGWNAVRRWLDDPELSADGITVDTIPYEDTKQYLSNVQMTAELYRRLYEE